MIVEFRDEETVYALIETDENLENIKQLLEEYRTKDNPEGYNIDEFLDFLKEHGVKFNEIPMEADAILYF